MKARPVVALSVAAAPAQLELGYGKEHLAEAFVRIARLLLRQGCQIAFGGDLRRGGFTALLLQLVRAENDSVDVTGSKTLRRSKALRRLTNFLSWPRYGDLDADQQARYLGVCRFVRVPPLTVPDSPGGPVDPVWQPLCASLALSAMRRAMQFGGVVDVDGKPVRGATARLVLGGKLESYSGLMPGILEEVALAWSAGAAPVPVFVLGGFGGAAASLAKGLLARQLPSELQLAWHEQRHAELHRRLALLDSDARWQRLAAAWHPRRHYALLQQACAGGLGGLCRRNGLSRRDNELLLESSDLNQVLGVITRAQGLRRAD